MLTERDLRFPGRWRFKSWSSGLWRRVTILPHHYASSNPEVCNTAGGQNPEQSLDFLSILDLDTIWRWVVSFTRRPPYQPYPLNRRLSGHQIRRRDKSLSCQKSNPGRPAPSIVTDTRRYHVNVIGNTRMLCYVRIEDFSILNTHTLAF